jgi:hypothetical protein
MRNILIAASALTFIAAPAFAADDIMAGYYGNTVSSAGGMFTSNTHYRADHTFDVVGSGMGMTKTFKGTWAIDAKGELCRTYVGEQPPGLPSNPFCIPWAAHKVGDKWTATFNGNSRDLELKAGVQ